MKIYNSSNSWPTSGPYIFANLSKRGPHADK